MISFFKKKTKEICPKCGTDDCLSMNEYQKHIKITGAGVLSVESKYIFKSCKARQQLKALQHLNIRSKNR